MGYSKEIIEAANRAMEQRRRQSITKAEQRRRSFFSRYPRALEIERELSRTAAKAAKAVLTGSNARLELERLKESNQALQSELAALLKSAGVSEDYLEIRYACPLCKDEGFVDGKMCSCMKQLLRDEAYQRLNALSPLSLSSFDTFSLDYYGEVPLKDGGIPPKKRMEDIYRYCKNYAANFDPQLSPSLLMQGATGLGKTHLSLAIARAAIGKGFGVIYCSAPNIIGKLEKERFRSARGSADESDVYLLECDLLILDDLGTEFPTSFSSSTIYNMINSRLMASRPTIISTNLTMRELEKQYSQRLVSRIMGNHVRLEFLGSDVRQKKRLIR